MKGKIEIIDGCNGWFFAYWVDRRLIVQSGQEYTRRSSAKRAALRAAEGMYKARDTIK